MEPLFINQYARDESVTKEYHNAHYSSPFFLVLYVFVGITFILNLVLAFITHTTYTSLLPLLIALIAFFSIRRYRISIALKRDKEQFGQPPTIVCEVSETGIRIGSNGLFSQEVPFCEIRHARETKHLILLTSRSRLLYILHKDGFVKGTLPEFNRFLWEKKVRFK